MADRIESKRMIISDRCRDLTSSTQAWNVAAIECWKEYQAIIKAHKKRGQKVTVHLVLEVEHHD